MAVEQRRVPMRSVIRKSYGKLGFGSELTIRAISGDMITKRIYAH